MGLLVRLLMMNRVQSYDYEFIQCSMCDRWYDEHTLTLLCITYYCPSCMDNVNKDLELLKVSTSD